jgi:hypothetical protein
MKKHISNNKSEKSTHLAYLVHCFFVDTAFQQQAHTGGVTIFRGENKRGLPNLYSVTNEFYCHERRSKGFNNALASTLIPGLDLQILIIIIIETT